MEEVDRNGEADITVQRIEDTTFNLTDLRFGEEGE